MSKLPRITAKDACRILERRGFLLARQSGGHKIYKNKEGRRATVPYHAGKILHPKVLKSILKDAEITIDELSGLL